MESGAPVLKEDRITSIAELHFQCKPHFYYVVLDELGVPSQFHQGRTLFRHNYGHHPVYGLWGSRRVDHGIRQFGQEWPHVNYPEIWLDYAYRFHLFQHPIHTSVVWRESKWAFDEYVYQDGWETHYHLDIDGHGVACLWGHCDTFVHVEGLYPVVFEPPTVEPDHTRLNQPHAFSVGFGAEQMVHVRST
ncbi:Ff.00g064820.m01.CDS01 [Fusarium sp. VM40]|nr:Ff.00g064820.m01.CDS01 [Fusarium sp. VM40]